MDGVACGGGVTGQLDTDRQGVVAGRRQSVVARQLAPRIAGSGLKQDVVDDDLGIVFGLGVDGPHNQFRPPIGGLHPHITEERLDIERFGRPRQNRLHRPVVNSVEPQVHITSRAGHPHRLRTRPVGNLRQRCARLSPETLGLRFGVRNDVTGRPGPQTGQHPSATRLDAGVNQVVPLILEPLAGRSARLCDTRENPVLAEELLNQSLNEGGDERLSPVQSLKQPTQYPVGAPPGHLPAAQLVFPVLLGFRRERR